MTVITNHKRARTRDCVLGVAIIALAARLTTALGAAVRVGGRTDLVEHRFAGRRLGTAKRKHAAARGRAGG
jgi:hypothetical protein